MTKSIYRSEAGKTEILNLYHKYWQNLGLDIEDRTIPTRFGDTHVMVTGPLDGKPILVFHGGNMVSPVSFAWLAGLAREFRIYAPDTIGHPGLSAENRLSPKNDEYGLWACDVIDALGLTRPIVQGSSYGAGIILNLASVAPEKIGKAILIVPAGFITPPMGPMMIKVVFPMLMFLFFHTRDWLLRTVKAMCPNPDPDVVEITGKIFEHVKIEPGMPRNISATELTAFTAPTLVMAAENDIYFPARLVLPRAKQIIPNLVGAEMLPHSGHLIDSELWPRVVNQIKLFINEDK